MSENVTTRAKASKLDTMLRVDNYTPEFDPEKEPILRVEHLKQYFKSTKAVDDVSFTIKKGEVFGLVGESGCGKTPPAGPSSASTRSRTATCSSGASASAWASMP